MSSSRELFNLLLDCEVDLEDVQHLILTSSSSGGTGPVIIYTPDYKDILLEIDSTEKSAILDLIWEHLNTQDTHPNFNTDRELNTTLQVMEQIFHEQDMLQLKKKTEEQILTDLPHSFQTIDEVSSLIKQKKAFTEEDNAIDQFSTTNHNSAPTRQFLSIQTVLNCIMPYVVEKPHQCTCLETQISTTPVYLLDFISTNTNSTRDCARVFFLDELIHGVEINLCGHILHLECYREFLQTSIEHDDDIALLYCPCPNVDDPKNIIKCTTLLNDYYIRPFISPEQYQKYLTARQTRSLMFIDGLTHCPYDNCTAQYDRTEIQEEYAKHNFAPHTDIRECVSCHQKLCVTCNTRILDEAQQHKCSPPPDDPFATHMVLQTLKKCPRCSVPFEKTVGCEFIKCRCGHTFCNICLSDMPDSNSHVCRKCNPH